MFTCRGSLACRTNQPLYFSWGKHCLPLLSPSSFAIAATKRREACRNTSIARTFITGEREERSTTAKSAVEFTRRNFASLYEIWQSSRLNPDDLSHQRSRWKENIDTRRNSFNSRVCNTFLNLTKHLRPWTTFAFYKSQCFPTDRRECRIDDRPRPGKRTKRAASERNARP